MGIKVDETVPPNFEAMQAMEHPELHDQSAPRIVMTTALMRLMTACGVRDFTLKDVIHPEYKRTVRHLSAIINFAKFREERLANYQAYMAETDALTDQRMALEDANEERGERIATIRAARAADEEQVAVLKEEVTALAAEINSVNTTQAGLQTEIRKVKDETTDVADAIAGKNFQIQTQEQARIALQSQIVQSPDRIKREIVDMGTTLEAEKENVSFLGTKLNELSNRTEALERGKGDVLKATKLLDETMAQLQKNKASKDDLEATKENIGAQQQQLKELAAQEQQHKRAEMLLQERMARMDRQKEQRREAATQALDNVRREREQIEMERAASNAKAETNTEARDAIEEEVASYRRTHDAEMAELGVEFDALHAQIGQYHTALLKATAAQVQ